jgi:hypothetical protein
MYRNLLENYYFGRIESRIVDNTEKIGDCSIQVFLLPAQSQMGKEQFDTIIFLARLLFRSATGRW